jgi:hypothetical protein
MAKIKDFARQWYQVKWTPGPDPGPIPEHAFKNDGILRIDIPPTPLGGAPACNVSWTDANEHPCSIKVLPFHEAKGTLHAPDIMVQFRTQTGAEKPVRLEATLWLDEKGQLNGTFGPVGPKGGQDANTGTFIADANPPGDDEWRKTRAEALALPQE